MASRFDSVVLDALAAAAPLNLEKVEALADNFGEKPRALIAAAVRAGIQYEKKARQSKAGGPVVSKEQLVSDIGAAVGVELPGLEKATKQALVALLAAVQ